MKTRHVLALVEGADHVCCRYRVAAFLPLWADRGITVTVQALKRDPAGRLAQFLAAGRHDAVLLQRKLLPRWQFAALRARARHLVFDFDDAVMYRDSHHPKGTHDPARVARFRHQAERCDVLVAGNAFLARHVRELHVFGPRVVVVPTCVDPAKYAVKSDFDAAGPFRLVWVGSSSTLKGVEDDRAFWDAIGRALPGLTMRVICDRFPDLGALAVEGVPWSEATEAEAIRGADVGVSFLPDDVWSHGKCGLKTLQYMASGLPVLANPVGVQADMVRAGGAGRLVKTIEETIGALKELQGDVEARRRLGQSARAAVERDYSVERWAGPLAEAVLPA